MIEADALVKRYGGFLAVKGVSFRVGSGEIVGLLGPNGAGKTTLMRILTCYHFPSAGTARVDSHDVTAAPHRVRRSVGYLPENSPLYPDMKVREYLSFIARVREMGRAEAHRRLEWAAETCGLGEVLTRDIGKLSKGYRQRVGLAQAMLHDPAVLVLDEPTAGLDPNQIVEIRTLIRSLGARKTVLLSTHIMQEVEALCGTVLIMSEGRIAAQGTAEQIAHGVKESVVLTVSLKGALDGEAVRSLAAVPGVKGVAEVRWPGPDRVEADLAFTPGSDPSEAVYDWAVSHAVKILGMSTRKTSLEELFARLTAGELGTDA